MISLKRIASHRGEQTRPLDPDGRARTRDTSGPGFAAYAAAGLSLLAALIHLWETPEHLAEWWGYGAFFLTAAFAQGLFSVLILRRPESQPILLAGIFGNLGIVALYVISYTWGVPFGPDWTLFSPNVAHLDDPDVLGISATAAEVGTIVAAVALLEGAYRKMVVNALLFLGALLWVLRLTGILP